MRKNKSVNVKKFGTRSKNGKIAELPLVLFILFVLLALPLIDLLCIVMAFGAESLMTHECATAAASQRDFDKVLTAVNEVASTFKQSGLASFSKMVPVAGYKSSGVDLFIEASNFRTVGTTEKFAANTPVPPPIDQNNWVYECTAQSKFQVGPAISMSGIPFLADIPGLGKPVVLTTTASRAAEHPDGLCGNGNKIASTSGLPSFNHNPTSSLTGPAAGPDGSGWNYPGIYDAIKAKGQTVVSQDVIQVYANDGNWLQTSVGVLPGQFVWLDTRAAGQWTVLGNGTYITDANGYSGNNSSWLHPNQPSLVPSANWASLCGQVGNNQPFMVGNTLTNYAVNQTGNLKLIVNDTPGSYGDNVGLQTVRIIITRAN